MEIHDIRRPRCFAFALCCFLLLSPLLEARTFTATDGRTLDAKVLKVNGDSAFLERNDGRAVTVPLDRLSACDREYLAAWAKNDAKDRLPRVKVTVDSNKRDSNIRAGYDERRGSFQFKIAIRNEERGFKIENATASLMVLGDYLHTPGETVVMQRADFKDISIDFGKTFEANAEEVRYEYYRGYASGQKYSGFIFVLKTATGKIIDITGSTSRLENLADIILKLKQEDHCNKRYQKIKTSGSGSPAIFR